MLALLRGKAEPARAIGEIVPRRIGGLQIEPRQIVLGVGAAEVGGSIGEHLPGPIRIGLDLRIGNAVEVIAPERDKGVGDDRRLRRRGTVLRMRAGDAAEIFEGAHVVLGDAVAVGIHPAQFPLCDRMAALGGILQCGQRSIRDAGRWSLLLERGRGSGLSGNHRDSRILIDRGAVKGVRGTSQRS